MKLLTEEADNGVHRDHRPRENPVCSIRLCIKRLSKCQLASDVGGETLAQGRHVDGLSMGFQQLSQEDVNLVSHGGLEGAQRTIREDLPIHFSFLLVTFPI